MNVQLHARTRFRAIRSALVVMAGLTLLSAGHRLWAQQKPPDLSTPAKAIIAFAEGWRAGDAQAMRSACLPAGDDDAKFIDALATAVGAWRNMPRQAEAKFGEGAGAGWREKLSPFAMASNIIARAATGIEIHGDTASLPDGPAGKPITMRKQAAGAWRVDLGTVAPAENRREMMDYFSVIVRVSTSISQRIRKGDFPDTDTAYEALVESLMQEMERAAKKPEK